MGKRFFTLLNRHFTKQDKWMANQHMKRCMTPLAIGETQNKIAGQHSIRIAKMKKTNHPKWP